MARPLPARVRPVVALLTLPALAAAPLAAAQARQAYALAGSGANVWGERDAFHFVWLDGRWVVFISFMPDVPPGDHPWYKQVYIRMMPAAGGPARVLAYVYGGQGTINVPSWSPDSKRVAFVSNTGPAR